MTGRRDTENTSASNNPHEYINIVIIHLNRKFKKKSPVSCDVVRKYIII